MDVAVRFPNARGRTLRGVLHLPDGPRAKGAPGLVWLPAGQKTRQGVWRMNVVLARHAARRGVPTLRFDFEGLGDSDGDRHHGRPVMDYYGVVQTGGCAGDVVAGAEYLMREAGVSDVVLGGLCGGAVSALFAAPTLGRRARSLLLVDLPVTISSASRQAWLEQHPEDLVRARPEVADHVLADYVSKALDPAAWRRLLTGESNLGLMAQTFRTKAENELRTRALPRLPAPLRARVEAMLGASLTADAPIASDDPAMAEREAVRAEVRNDLLGPRLREALAAGQRVRFVNSSTYHPVFQAYFGATELGDDEAAWAARGLELEVVPEANHLFTLPHAQRRLFAALERALELAPAPASEAAAHVG